MKRFIIIVLTVSFVLIGSLSLLHAKSIRGKRVSMGGLIGCDCTESGTNCKCRKPLAI